MKYIHHTRCDIDRMEKRFRVKYVNSLSGFKSVNLCGTIDRRKRTNLAIISSVVHLGANPALMGMIMRSATVPRHTLANIMDTGHYTLNHIKDSFYSRAHQTSARHA